MKLYAIAFAFYLVKTEKFLIIRWIISICTLLGSWPKDTCSFVKNWCTYVWTTKGCSTRFKLKNLGHWTSCWLACYCLLIREVARSLCIALCEPYCICGELQRWSQETYSCLHFSVSPILLALWWWMDMNLG